MGSLFSLLISFLSRKSSAKNYFMFFKLYTNGSSRNMRYSSDMKGILSFKILKIKLAVAGPTPFNYPSLFISSMIFSGLFTSNLSQIYSITSSTNFLSFESISFYRPGRKAPLLNLYVIITLRSS